WLARAKLSGYSSMDIGLGLAASVPGFLWLVACVRWMGWPHPRGRETVVRVDLLRFIVFGLLLYPLGLALLALLGDIQAGFAGQLSSVIQTLFAKYFGVVVVTLPLVVAWTERRRGPLVV